jgi:two-component system, chemotaxis family, response regulator PixG
VLTLGWFQVTKISAVTMSSGILDQIKFCRNKLFTGKLCATSLNGETVDTLEGHCWNIYFYRGRLVGDSGGIHPLRRLRRQFSEQQIDLTPQVEENIFKSLGLNHLSFDIVGDLLTDRYLDLAQAERILAGSLVEVLFDILHYEAISQVISKNQLSYILENDSIPETRIPVILMKPDVIWETSLSQFQSWNANGLLKYSPHLLPQINSLDVLQEILPTKTFQKVTLLIEENRTLRDLAIKIDEDIVILTKSFVGLCKKNALVLRHAIDIDLIEKKLKTEIDKDGVADFLIHGSQLSVAFTKKLIIHITQNLSETSTIQDFVEKAGHRYINLKESTQALITFLKYHPDLIVMDNSSAGIKVQDLCDQLRRTSKFKNTPIVVINKNEMLLERLRNNSIEYVSKPLNHQKIFSIMNKYLIQKAS